MKLQTLKGFRDFLPKQARKRQYLINTLKEVFELYGFEPLETPALEYEEVLLGKYGGEGDKLMYRFEDRGGRKIALRYDQTVPLARVVAQYGDKLPLPFKRYQIQPVWRAENPQKGRFREFLQCDIDTVGTNSIQADAEILALIYESYKKLGLDIVIEINDRALLAQISTNSLAVLDKLNKIGEKGVIKELQKIGLSLEKANNLLRQAKSFKASMRLRQILDIYEKMGYSKSSWRFNPTLARGLDYYTGMILEVVQKSTPTSLSLGGGGRYDKLIGIFAGKQIPAVGFSFGFDRLYEAMEEQKLFPDDLDGSTTQILVTVFPGYEEQSMKLTSTLRSEGVNTELYLDEAKLDKQLKYADKNNISYVVIIGPEEVKKKVVKLKDMKTGEQKTVSVDELLKILK